SGRKTSAQSTEARIAGQSRAADGLSQPWSSSARGSATGGLGQKIALDDKLADLGVKLAHLHLTPLIALAPLAVENSRHAVNRLALPSGDQVRMNSVLAGKLRYRQLATDRFHSHLRLELSRKPSARRHRRSSFSDLDPP